MVYIHASYVYNHIVWTKFLKIIALHPLSLLSYSIKKANILSCLPKLQVNLNSRLIIHVCAVWLHNYRHFCAWWPICFKIFTHYFIHYIDVIMTTMASQITSLTVVYSTVYSDGADQRKHQSSASLAFVWGIHQDLWIPRTKDQLRGKCFHLMTSSCSLHHQKLPKTTLTLKLESHVDMYIYDYHRYQHVTLSSF